MRRPAGALLGFLLAAMPPSPQAVEIRDVGISYEAPRYRVNMQVVLDAPATRTYAVFADPAQLARINPALREVRILEAPVQGAQRLATVVRVCIAGFCRHLRQVQDMRYAPRGDGGGEVQARVIPERSDFRYGHATWSFRGCGTQQTCLHFQAELEPAFWAPPLIGPWLIQRKLRSEAIATSQGLERLARDAP